MEETERQNTEKQGPERRGTDRNRTVLRLAALTAMAATVAAVVWLAARYRAPSQPMSLSVAVDRGTEAMETADRVGKILTRLPSEEEIALGRAIAGRVAPGASAAASDEAGRRQAYVEAIVANLVESGGLRRPRIPYTVRVLDRGEANAFALPGGWIFITAPLLELLESEAEVASVLGHEMAHVDLRHCVERIQYEVLAGKVGGDPFQQMVAIGSRLWSLGYTDEQELEADRRGMLYAARAGYHPQAAARALGRLAELHGERARRPGDLGEEVAGMLAGALDEYFATHPPTAERVAALERAWREHRLDLTAGTWYVGRENHRTQVARSERELPGEWVTGRL